MTCPGGSSSCRRGVGPKFPGYECMDEAAGERTPHNCSAGWKPDPLLDIPKSGIPVVPAGVTQPLLIECCIPREAEAGNYSGSFAVSAVPVSGGGARIELLSVQVKLEVWPITIPEVGAKESFTTMFTFNGADPPHNTGLTKWYPDSSVEELWTKWFPFLSHYRVPGDSSYSQGRPTEEHRTGFEWRQVDQSASYWLPRPDAAGWSTSRRAPTRDRRSRAYHSKCQPKRHPDESHSVCLWV